MNTYQYNQEQTSIRFISGESKFADSIPVSHRFFKQVEKQVEDGLAQILPYVEPDITLAAVRGKRNTLLKESDVYLFEDFPIPQNVTKEQILIYRQALRDMTEGLNLTGVKSIDDVVFPTKPF